MRSRIMKMVCTIIGLSISVVFAFGQAKNVYAVTESFNAVTAYKGLYQGVYKCYNKGAMKSSLGSLSSWSGIETILSSKAASTSKSATVHLVKGFKDGKFDMTASGDAGRIATCKSLFSGWSGATKGKITAIVTASGKSVPGVNAVTNTKVTFLENMGYTKDSEKGEAAKCFRLPYNSNSWTNSVCQNSAGSVTVEGKKTQAHFRIGSSGKAGTSSYKQKVCLYLPTSKNANQTRKWGCKKAPAKDGLNGDYLIGLINDVCGSKTCKATVEGKTKTFAFSASSEAVYSDTSSGDVSMTLSNKTAAGLKAISFMTGGKYTSLDSIKIGRVEERLLYQAYLTSYYGVKVSCASGESDAAYDGTVKWLVSSTGEIKTCHYEDNDVGNKKNEKVNKVSSNRFLIGSFTYKQLISAMNKLPEDYTEEELAEFKQEVATAEEEAKAADDGGEDGEGESGTDAKCYENSGALGWILCPVIKGLTSAGEKMWEAVSGMLNIPAAETFGSDSGVYNAWEIIRNIANIMFIILFLVVIFSQLTGVGIDNYGIKRILPKLIVAAVLINVSYALCELAVDISNILGNSLEGLLGGQAGAISNIGDESSAGSQTVATIVGLALAGGGAYLWVLLNPLGIIAAGIAVISVIISVVTAIAFMYLILVIRQAGVIMMVVLAPAAIVCYMLPNTEKMFKKWLDLFKALLVVYPLCGAIVGAGQLASAVLSSIDTTAMKIAAMIIQVVPFFLIPTLLKNSLSLMGNIGAKLQSAAGRARRGAAGAIGGGIRNSEYAQDYADRLGARRAENRMDRIKSSVGGDLTKMSEGQRNRYMRSAARLEKYDQKRAGTYDYINDQLGKDNLSSEFVSAMASNDKERAASAYRALEKVDAEGALNLMSSSVNWGGMNKDFRDHMMRTMAGSNTDAAKGYAKYMAKGGTDSFGNWVDGVAADKDSDSVKGYGSYAQHLSTNGPSAMGNYSKDEMKFVKNKAGALMGDGALTKKDFGSLLANSAINNTSNPTAQNVVEDIIKDEIAKSNIGVDDLGLTAESLGSMRAGLANAIKEGYAETLKTPEEKANVEEFLRGELREQIKAAQSDDRIRNKMNGDVGAIFGVK